MGNKKKIKTGIDKIDEVLLSGLTKGDLSVFIGKPNSGKTKIVFDIETESPFYSRVYSKEMADKITEKAQCLLCDTVKMLKENGFDTSAFKMSKTRYEKLGDTVFPVTYGPNGIVIVDYPNKPFVQDNQNPIVQDMTNKIVQDNQNPNVQNNQNDIIQDNK